MTTQEAIETYYSHFKKQLNEISDLQNRLHKKILFVVMMDTLARARHPNVASNKQRFLKLIDDCSAWVDRNRVSLPLLSLRISSTVTNKLEESVLARLANWDYGRIYDLSVDPPETELEPLAKSEFERQAIQNSRHADLLYIYRNHLIHEFREPGSGIEMDQRDTAPYYHGMTHLNHAGRIVNESWELVYPLGFFKVLVGSCLRNLKAHLEKNALNPYSFYEFGTLWKRNL